MRAASSRRAQLAALLALLAAAPAAADGDRVAATKLPTCTDGEPFLVYIVDATADDDCDATGGGTTEAPCLCLDGAYVAMLASGGAASDSFKTQNTPSGTDPVADSSTDTLNWTAGAGITLTGDSTTDTITVASTIPSITLDLGDDAGNDSTALAEIATVNDNGGAFTESSADKLSIDVAKLRPASFDNQRETAHSYDCEFDGDLCSFTWSADGGSGSSAPVSGTVNPVASVSGDPVYDLMSWPGHLLIQSDESSQAQLRLKESVTLDTNATIVAAVSFQAASVNAAAEGSIYLYLTNSGDTNEIVYTGLANTSGAGYSCRGATFNNGSESAVTAVGIAEGQQVGRAYLWIFKTSNTYRYGCSASDGHVPYIFATSHTKTGVTTLNELQVMVQTANETPSIVWSVDWVRYYASNTLAVLNK